MKKTIITLVIVLGLDLTSFADPNGGGLFQRGTTPESPGFYGSRDAGTPMLPNHGKSDNQDADGPIGGGIAVLLGLGAAYLVGKKRKEK